MLPLTRHTPKPLLRVAGKPLLFWHLERLSAQGIQQVVINVSHLGNQIREAVGDGSRWQLQVHCSEEQQPLETGGGLLQALPLLQPEPFLLLNADVWCSHLPALLGLHTGQLAHLLLVANPPHHPEGDFYLDDNSNRLSNDAQPAARSLTFAGISLLHPQALQATHLQAAYGTIPPAGTAFPLAPLLRHLIRQELATGSLLPGDWVDVGTPERLQQLDQELMSKTSGAKPA